MSAEYLKAWRKFSGYTQGEVAERLKMKRQTVSRIENGTGPYDQHYLEGLADLVGCHAYELLMRAPDTYRKSMLNAGSGE